MKYTMYSTILRYYGHGGHNRLCYIVHNSKYTFTYLNFLALALICSSIFSGTAVAATLTVEKPNRLTRLFWDTPTTIDKDTFNAVLLLMNKCLELKLENELFVVTLQQLSNVLKTINTDLESQALLKQRIDSLIKALSQRSTYELSDIAFMQGLFSSLGIQLPKQVV